MKWTGGAAIDLMVLIWIITLIGAGYELYERFINILTMGDWL